MFKKLKESLNFPENNLFDEFMLVSIIIVNWNRLKDTLECLKSLENIKTGFNIELVIIDNASTDGSPKKIREYFNNHLLGKKDFSFNLIENRINLGFCGGNNIGIGYALKNNADFILLLNNDTLVDGNFLLNLTGVFGKYPDAGIVSPKIYFRGGYEFHKSRYKKTDLGKVIWYAGGDIDWKNVYGSNHGVDQVDHGQFDKITETDFATGACMIIRRQVIEDIGMLDEKYFMYFEDDDLSVRAKKAGWKVLYAPKAHIWHKVSQSSGIGGPLNDYFITRNRLLFGMRYASLRTRFALYRESLKLLSKGRKWQKKGVIDFYFRKFGRGSWSD